MKPKMLITGSRGMIAQYVIREVEKDHCLYGLTHSETSKDNQKRHIHEICCDTNDYDRLDFILSLIKPNSIVHLASISSSRIAFENVIQTIGCNGMSTVNLCNIIHKNKWNHVKLFNASSSEIYKGHNQYTVKENDHNMYHLHPYSIAKILGHSTVDFYRTEHNMKFYNGILFTVESPQKSPEFLLNKVARHARNYKSSKKVLKLGQLDSYRNIIHADDVAIAIRKILEADVDTNYCICNIMPDGKNVKVLDLVLGIYKRYGIKVTRKDNLLIDESTGDTIVIITGLNKGFDTCPTDILGYPENLIKLGWKPKYSVEDILDDICSS